VSRRVLIEGGASPKFRISKPGVDVVTATDREDFIIREDDVTVFYPDFQGSFTFTGSGTQSLVLSPALTVTPVVFLKSSDGWTPSTITYYAWLSEARNELFVRNYSGSRTVYYYVYGNALAGM
jgi:hypothetical protein